MLYLLFGLKLFETWNRERHYFRITKTLNPVFWRKFFNVFGAKFWMSLLNVQNLFGKWKLFFYFFVGKNIFLSSYCWIKRSFCEKRLASIYGRKATFPETEQTKKLSQSCVDGFFHSSGQSWQISIRFEVVVILLFFRPLRMPSVSLTWLWQIVKVSWTGYWRFI